MQAVYDWVKGIVFYLILLTVITHLIPGKKYDKYLRLFTGMLLVMIVIKPVVHLFSADEIFDRNFLKVFGENAGTELYYDEELLEQFEHVRTDQLLEEYIKQVKSYAQSEAHLLGMKVLDIEVTAAQQEDLIVPTSIRMTVSNEEQTEKTGQIEQITITDIVIQNQSGGSLPQAGQLKHILQQYYGLEEQQVQVISSDN